MTLEDRLLAAHAREDTLALVGLYEEAATQADDLDATCFFLTQAYVYALDTGHPMAADLRARLVRHGRA